MRIFTQKLREIGYAVEIGKDVVTIFGTIPPDEELVKKIRSLIPDPSLQDYAVGAALRAIENAQILSVIE
jgi:hypothetical protein